MSKLLSFQQNNNIHFDISLHTRHIEGSEIFIITIPHLVWGTNFAHIAEIVQYIEQNIP